MNLFSRRALLGLGAALFTARAGHAARNQENADMVVVFKSSRRLYLYRNGEALRRFPIALGWAPTGTKQREGDGRTPEGVYYIDRLNPNSSFHLSLGISYPNPDDRARAQSEGVSPGGDIFIHGQEMDQSRAKPDDWTAGCIAVSNRAVEEIFSRVPVGTPILIQP